MQCSVHLGRSAIQDESAYGSICTTHQKIASEADSIVSFHSISDTNMDIIIRYFHCTCCPVFHCDGQESRSQRDIPARPMRMNIITNYAFSLSPSPRSHPLLSSSLPSLASYPISFPPSPSPSPPSLAPHPLLLFSLSAAEDSVACLLECPPASQSGYEKSY